MREYRGRDSNVELPTQEDEKNIRRRTAVNMAVNTLSYSELRAVSAILSGIEREMRTVDCFYHCRSIGIPRSVIVNTLRSRSAGIESRSFWNEGNLSQVLIPDIFEEIKKEITND